MEIVRLKHILSEEMPLIEMLFRVMVVVEVLLDGVKLLLPVFLQLGRFEAFGIGRGGAVSVGDGEDSGTGRVTGGRMLVLVLEMK